MSWVVVELVVMKKIGQILTITHRKSTTIGLVCPVQMNTFAGSSGHEPKGYVFLG